MRDHLQRCSTRPAGNITHTAAILGIARNTLRSRIRKLGIKGSGRPGSSVDPREEAPLGVAGSRHGAREMTPTPARLRFAGSADT